MNKVTRFISDIIFDKEVNLVSFPLKTDDNFWDSFVKIGSSHYIIPLLYYKLKERGYLKLLNDQLVSYLEEIFNQNLKRNESLVEEVYEISKVLSDNNVDHVFLKGAALLKSLYSEKVGVRMLGDIDILVKEKDIEKVEQLFVSLNYSSLHEFNFCERHISRLINDKKVFGIEFHTQLIERSSKDLVANDFFIRKQKNKQIPSYNDLLFHIILSYQKDDFGSMHASFSFRTLFDVYSLKKSIEKLDQLLSSSIHTQKIKIVMSEFSIIQYKTPKRLFAFNLRLKLKKASVIFKKIDNLLSYTFVQFFLLNIRKKQIRFFISNKNYRDYVFKKIGIKI